MRGLDEVRIRLFRLVLCSSQHLSTDALTHALCIRINDERLYNQDLSNEDVEALYSNFLIRDVKGRLVFAHDSAR